jgi:hypothetical protein
MKSQRHDISPLVPPSGESCAECLASGGWWLHLRRCTECGHVGCCDSSPSQHASKHFHTTGIPSRQASNLGSHGFSTIGVNK